MTEETAQLFDAPWGIIHDGVSEDMWITDKNENMVACIPEKSKHAIRISHLPELYEGLKDSTWEICAECIHDNFRMGRIVCDEDYDFIENGCPFPEFSECAWKHCWTLLKKVRDGK